MPQGQGQSNSLAGTTAIFSPDSFVWKKKRVDDSTSAENFGTRFMARARSSTSKHH